MNHMQQDPEQHAQREHPRKMRTLELVINHDSILLKRNWLYLNLKARFLGQCVQNLSTDQIHLEGFFKHRLLGTTCDSVGP